jgi:pimeloyl-ACP methyl ester carboxylesterase
MLHAILQLGQSVALMTMMGMMNPASERRIEVPLDPAGGLPIAEVVSALAQASGVAVERPAVGLTLPTRGLGGSLTRTLLGECLGSEVALVFRPGVVVLVVEEGDLGAGRRSDWQRRLEDLSARSVQAASRQHSYGMRALASYRPNDPTRPTVCLVHGLNSSSGGFVHVTPLLEQAGYGIVVYDYPFNQRLADSCAQFRRDWIAFRKTAGEQRPWAIVAHSMGALVVRSYVERADRTDQDVASLIMIAPVNQGAHVARIQPVFQTINSLFAINSKRTSQALAQLSDGIGQAAEDLLPGSAFLRELNGGTRAPGVPYHILAGNSGLIPREIRVQAQAQLEEASRGSGFLGVLSRVANRDLGSLLDELSDDSGDGCVAVDRTRLPGVDDHITIRANHAELIRAPLLYPDEGPVPCMPYVLRWLGADLPVKRI